MSEGMSKTLMLRWLSAAILIPFVIYALSAGGLKFYFFIGAALIVTLLEWQKIAASLPRFRISLGLLMAVYFICGFLTFGKIYHREPNGEFWALTLMLVVWASDTGAYFVGKWLKGPLLAPTISPRKTWAGFLGAMVAGGASLKLIIILAPVFNILFPNNLAPSLDKLLIAFGVGMLLGAIGQWGDLMISIFKRKANVKDSGGLIPGHGGLLDRIDGLLLVAPCFYLWIRVLT
ncbi:MAG: phosphatidate cytidylyltransferase [Alphaproteobacteria bacterium]|nr:phosphatidate cytidylyltransferase [Alphaproteobacteria bacterium]